MNYYFIVVNNIDKEDYLDFEIYRYDTEHSLKPEKMSVETFEPVDRLIDVIEDIICNDQVDTVEVFASSEYVEKFFDVDINEFTRLTFKYNNNVGYRVAFIPKRHGAGNRIIELIDTSAHGLARYLKRLVKFS
jgi:hypothetical protein